MKESKGFSAEIFDLRMERYQISQKVKELSKKMEALGSLHHEISALLQNIEGEFSEN